MTRMTRTAGASLVLALLMAGCSSAASPSPSDAPSPTASPTAEATANPTAEPTAEPTATPAPTGTPAPTDIPPQSLTVDLSLIYARGTIEGPGRCDIGANESALYIEHRQGGVALDVLITIGPAAGGMSGPPLTPGGGTYGDEVVRIRVSDPQIGSFVDATDTQMIVASGLKSGTFTATWDGEPLSGDYTCS